MTLVDTCRVGRWVPVCTAWGPVGLGYDLAHLGVALPPRGLLQPSLQVSLGSASEHVGRKGGSGPTWHLRGGSESDLNPSSGDTSRGREAAPDGVL